jgi:outer membrane protein OmpA-like peptidoglycan-associated protein/N-acetylneuraminic acid mutarotase
MMNRLCIFIFFLSSHFLFSQTNNPWEKRSGFSGGISEKAVAFTCGDYGYAGLGTDNAVFRKDFWKYSFENDKWEKTENFPDQARISAVAFSIGGKGYAGTGLVGVESRKGTNDFWEYDPATNTWSQKANLPGGTRYGAVGFAIGGRGYVALGVSQTTFYNDIWEYNPGNNQWTKKIDFPENGRADASVFVIGNEAYIAFGQGKEIFVSKKNCWKFSPVKNEWKMFADFPDAPRAGVIAFAFGNKGYAAGGTNGTTKRFEDLWEYDAVKNKWQEKTDLPFGSCAYGFALVKGDKAFVCTGRSKPGSSGAEVWQFTFTEPPPTGNLIIGGSLLLGDERIPHAGIEVKITNTKGDVIKSAFTNLFGSFLMTGLPENEDLIFTFDASDPGVKNEKFILVNKKGEGVAVLNKDNQFKFYLSSTGKNKIQLIKLENKNLRMNMKGKLVLDDKKRTPLANVTVSLMNEDEEVMQAGTTDESGVFGFDYLPVDSMVYLSIDEKMVQKVSKGEKILLLDDGDNLVSKTSASHTEFELVNLPPEKNSLTKVFMEDSWIPFLSNKYMELKVVEPIYFDVAKWEILPEAKAILNKAVALLKTNPKYTIEISAHTDSRGDEKSNQVLSEKRASAAKDYIVSRGVNANQITTKGYGESKLVNKCKDGVTCTEEEHAQNRRMEFIIRKK